MVNNGDWIDLTDALTPEDGARLVRLLTEQEIDARLDGGKLQVPAELEGDAVAVLAGADEDAQAAPEVDRANQLARLTAPVTPDRLPPMLAWEYVLKLHAAAIEATTDLPTQSLTGMDVTAGCNVLVAPADVPRAHEVIAHERAAPEDDGPDWLIKTAKAVVADGLEREQAQTLRRALGMHGLASIAREEHGAWAVRVRPGDDSLAQDVLQRLALGARADAEAAAADAIDAAAVVPDAPEAATRTTGASNTATIITFLALAALCFIAMRACGG